MKDINIKIISKWIEQTLYINPEYQENILKSLIIILALVIIRFIVIRIADQKIENQQVFYRFQKTTKYFFWFFLIVLVGRIWFQGIQSLATFLGLVSAGIAIALKDPLVNLAGWAFIFWQKPFEVGERIELAGVKGDVIDINTFQFDLLEVRKEGKRETNTGRIIHMPNGKIFTDSLSNYDKTFPFIWDVISTQVTFESNWKNAREIFEEVGEKFSKRYSEEEIHRFKRATRNLYITLEFEPVVFTAVQDCGVEIILRYIVEPRSRGIVRTKMWEEILTKFAENPDIDFAYPTQRFYNNLTEGKVKGS